MYPGQPYLTVLSWWVDGRVEIRQSTIPSAGRGAFLVKGTFKKGDIITLPVGLAQDNFGPTDTHTFESKRNYYVNGHPANVPDELTVAAFAAMCNEDLRDQGNNNLRILNGGTMAIVATRDINRGEELLLPTGALTGPIYNDIHLRRMGDCLTTWLRIWSATTFPLSTRVNGQKARQTMDIIRDINQRIPKFRADQIQLDDLRAISSPLALPSHLKGLFPSGQHFMVTRHLIDIVDGELPEASHYQLEQAHDQLTLFDRVSWPYAFQLLDHKIFEFHCTDKISDQYIQTGRLVLQALQSIITDTNEWEEVQHLIDTVIAHGDSELVPCDLQTPRDATYLYIREAYGDYVEQPRQARESPSERLTGSTESHYSTRSPDLHRRARVSRVGASYA
jgi:hypothetical protein